MRCCSGDLIENAKYLAAEKSRLAHSEQMKVHATKKKLTDSMVKGGFPNTLAKHLADLMHAEQGNPVPNVTAPDQIRHDCIMRFDADDGTEISAAVLGEVRRYQEACSQSISAKSKTLHSYLDSEKSKASVATPVRVFGADQERTADNMPDLTVAMLLLGGSSYEDLDGASPWLISQRSFAERMGAAAYPLPGFPSLIQLAQTSYAPTSFLLIPVQALVDSGLTVLQDLLKFLSQDAGVDVIKQASLFVTLDKPSEVLWLPWGMLPVPIGREPYSEKTPRSTTYWVKTFFTASESLKISHQAFTALELLNKPHLKKLSGQKIWKARLDIYEKLVSARAVITGSEAPTVPDEFAEDEAMAEAKAAATASVPSAVVIDCSDENDQTANASAAGSLRSRPKAAAKKWATEKLQVQP